MSHDAQQYCSNANADNRSARASAQRQAVMGPPLAMFGGPPRFAEPLHVGRPNIGVSAAFFERVQSAFHRRWLSNNGVFVQEFERKLEMLVGARHVIAVANGTLGLELTVRALGLTGEVIVPSFTFIATAHALQWQGIRPVFCDIDYRTCLMDVASVESAIGPNTTGIVGVHLWGEPCDVDALTTLARRHGLSLILDAAHALGAATPAGMVGVFGDAEVFSFHATKFVNAFEGGAIATNNDALASRLRRMRNFGYAAHDAVESVGTNAKMNEISAAMGLTSLESMEAFIATNVRNYERYRHHLDDLAGIEVMEHRKDAQRNHQYVVIRVNEAMAGLSRDKLMEVLHAENVLARRYYWPGCHNMEPYRSRPTEQRESLPVTDRVVNEVLALPTGTGTSLEDVTTICEIIRGAVEWANGR